MQPNRMFFTAAALFAALVTYQGAAQALYKLIDKNGKVTYSEVAPKDFDGKVIRIDIDPNANTMVAPKLPASQRGEESGPTQNEKIIRRSSTATQEQKVREAREKVDAARTAFENARDNASENDFIWVGLKGGGTRRVPTEEYAERMTRLERDLQAAEEELKTIERAP